MGRGNKCLLSRPPGEDHLASRHPYLHILDPSLQWQVLLVGVSGWGLRFWM